MRNRNPRRAYNREGVEQPPMWLGNMRSLGCRKVLVECVACRRMASVNVDTLPDEVPVPDVAISWRRLVCSACGARGERLTTRPDLSDRPGAKKGGP
jgi:hypothetical protein